MAEENEKRGAKFKMSNQFWKNRSEHGRDLLFNSPDELKAACQRYFNWCDSQMWGKVHIPYTLSGLCLYLNTGQNWWREMRKAKKLTSDISLIMDWCEEIIYNKKFTGAAVGVYNANLIARDLGLADKIQNEHTGANGSGLFENMTDEELLAKAKLIQQKMIDGEPGNEPEQATDH